MNGVHDLFLVLHGDGRFVGRWFGEDFLREDVVLGHASLPLYPQSLLVLYVLIQFTDNDGRDQTSGEGSNETNCEQDERIRKACLDFLRTVLENFLYVGNSMIHDVGQC